HSADQVVLESDQGGLAGARSERQVRKAVPIECLLYRDRAAEAGAAVEREVRTAGEVQVEHVEERLVPADGDAVLGDAAEPAGDALVERLLRHLVEVLERRAQEILRDRLDL